MKTVWISIVAVSVANAVIKAAGPVLVGGRELPARARGVIGLLAPALLTALVVSEVFGEDGRVTVDASALGVLAAAAVLALRGPIVLAVAVAAAVTALTRALA
ncbi:MAG TPA: AzlD domain-containing protein [Gaiellaceae bacterium]|nr:AzlD domain-containing protein [Gaiellaceae bacterium]